MIYTDIHTHLLTSEPDVVAVRNIHPDEAEMYLAPGCEGLFSTGIHPWHLNVAAAGWYEKLEKICSDSRIALIGECGLDKYAAIPLEIQKQFFEKHIQLSERISKPLIVHCVGAFSELLELRKKYRPSQRWIIHGFRGKPQLAEQILRSGCDISFGAKWNPGSLKCVPLENLFVETDESTKSVREIYSEIAAVKGCLPAQMNAGSKLLNC